MGRRGVGPKQLLITRIEAMSTDPVTYHGSCHCGAVQFEFQSPAIDSAMQCNCSICRRKNALMSKQYFAPEKFELLSGNDALSLYHWGDQDVNHYFCKYCGIYPFHDSIYEPGKYRVNLGCVDELDLGALKIGQFDGANLL